MAVVQRLTELWILSVAVGTGAPACGCGTSHTPGDAASEDAGSGTRDGGHDARVPRDAESGDSGDADVDAWLPAADAGTRCGGDFVPAGIRLDPGAHVFDVTFGDAAVWYWPSPSVLTGTQRILRISRDLEAIDESRPMEGLPMTLGGTTFYGWPTYVLDPSGTAALVRVQPSTREPRRLLLATYGTDGTVRAGPVDVGDVRVSSPTHVARDGDAYVLLDQTDAASPTCSTTLRHVRADPVTRVVETAPDVELDGVQVDRVAWRGDRWTVWAWTSCVSGPDSAVLFDVLPDGGVLGPRAVAAWSDAFTGAAPRPRESGDWPMLFHETGPWGDIVHYARLDPAAGTFTTPPTAVATTTAVAEGNILLAARDDGEDALLFVELEEHVRGRTRFVRVQSDGVVLQDSILTDGPAPPPIFLLRWVGDRYIASFGGVVDALICSGAP